MVSKEVKDAIKTVITEAMRDIISSTVIATKRTLEKEAVVEGKKLLCKRQKLIKIAYREENSRENIKCYQLDILVSNSDDQNRLNKSRRQARINKKETKKKG